MAVGVVLELTTHLADGITTSFGGESDLEVVYAVSSNINGKNGGGCARQLVTTEVDADS